MWKVDVAELLFEIANCSCLKPPITDSLLRGSKEESMLTAPFLLDYFWCGKSMLLSSILKLPIAPVSIHQ